MVTYDERDRIGAVVPKLSIGGTIRDTSRIIGRAWLPLYGLAVVAGILSVPSALLYSRILTKSAVPKVDPGANVDPSFYKILGAVFVVQMFVSLYIFAVMSAGASQVLESDRLDLGAALKTGIARYVPMLASALMFYILLVVALALLLVPGIIAGAVYGLAPTLCVIERRGAFASFSRSAALTRGNRWRCVGATLIVILVPALIQFALNAGLTVLLGAQVQIVISSLTGILVMPIFYVFPTALAFDLRKLQVGGAPGGVADVF